MALNWLGSKDESLPVLIARKKYSKAIELLKAGFREGGRDPRVRMQLADVLVMAGRKQEAVPILMGVADEFAIEGFAAKAIAVFKKIQKLEPGRADVERRLARLIKTKDSAAVELPKVQLPELEIGFEPSAVPAERTPVSAPAAQASAGAAAPEAESFDEQFLGDLPAEGELSEDLFREQVLDVLQETLAQPADPGTEAAQPAARRISPLFEDFSDEELLAVMRGLELLTFEPGDIIITEGEPGHSLFVLTTGLVKAFVKDPAGHHALVREMEEGSFFGEISILRGSPRTATITAAARCELLELDKTALDQIVATHPRVLIVLDEFYRQRANSQAEAQVRGTRRLQSR